MSERERKRERVKLRRWAASGPWRQSKAGRAHAEGGRSSLPAGLGEERKRKDLGEMKAI